MTLANAPDTFRRDFRAQYIAIMTLPNSQLLLWLLSSAKQPRPQSRAAIVHQRRSEASYEVESSQDSIQYTEGSLSQQTNHPAGLFSAREAEDEKLAQKPSLLQKPSSWISKVSTIAAQDSMAVQDGLTTLRHLLTQQKPRIPCHLKTGRNSRATGWPEPTVTIWTDFELAKLNESYGHILDSAISESRLPPPDPATHAITEEKYVKNLLLWNNALMQQTLQPAKTRLGLAPGTALQYRCSTADSSFYAKIPTGSSNLVVDHVIALDDVTLPHLVVGLGRPSTKWSGRKLANQLPAPGVEVRWPIRQLANLCETAETRYGYIQTDEEMVVCCFSKSSSGGWKAAIMPIPWTKYGDEVLTTDLALWWLCMLAMSDPAHRAIIAEDEMAGIGHWDGPIYWEEEQIWIRRHRYSKVEVPTAPPSPPAYEAPSPGNPAAWMAAVGLHADEAFNLEDPGVVNVNDPVPTSVNFADPNLPLNLSATEPFNIDDYIAFNATHPG
ncbi:hypothetical protein GP486_006246 [Trichoglossum hirsutum]|uniref:Uncharacterized protein n=1 Tax=Trichoglossum hirsutum TaxID=265104 RepID=A0A9P8L5Q8_9PEZI|nr:hypothetical protein GP486_006246 [Trichoglossum hirsutum]